MTKLPYSTTNRSLAIALWTAGVPLLEVRNSYSQQMLSRWGFKTAAEAVKARRTGIIEFHLAYTDRLEALVDVFDDQAKKPNTEASVIGDDVPDDERAVRLVCHSQKARKAIEQAIESPFNAWEIHGDFGNEMSEFLKRDNEIRRKLQAGEAEGLSAEQVLSPDEIGFISTPHSFDASGVKIINAMSKETRKRIGL